ncbi:hypothetical protein [Bacillus paranthracis]|uniref:hypothetical protein n=1 Tax=Bacillus paranthracis TaxID=2026186 RepID=UPI003D64F4C1
MYKTLSHTDELNKFRVVFILDKPLMTPEEVYGAYDYLASKFPEIDPSCCEPARFFYGGIASEEIDYMNVLPTEGLPVREEKVIKKRTEKKAQEIAVVEEIKPVVSIGEVATWKLIRQGNVDEVKKRLSVYGKELHSKVQAMNYLKMLNMRDVLGIKEGYIFDFFHTENSPSASVFRTEEGNYLYKCHSTNAPFTGDIIKVVAKLQKVGYTTALKYLMNVCNITEVMTEDIKTLREQCDIFTALLLSPNLKDEHPAIHNRFYLYKKDIVAILSIFKENVYQDGDDFRSLTWMSVRTLSKQLYNGEERHFNKVIRILNLMCLTNWIDKLSDETIPPVLLEKLKKTQDVTKRDKRSNVFELLTLGDDFFEVLNLQCEAMQQDGFTMRGFSREYVLRSYGEERANMIFPQEKGQALAKNADKFATDMAKIVMKAIEKDGYAIEKDIIAKMQKKWKSKGYTEARFKRCITELLTNYCLERKRLSKDLRARLGVKLPAQSTPTILFKAS